MWFGDLITLLLTFSPVKQKLHLGAIRQLNEIVGVELEVVPALGKRPINVIIIIIGLIVTWKKSQYGRERQSAKQRSHGGN